MRPVHARLAVFIVIVPQLATGLPPEEAWVRRERRRRHAAARAGEGHSQPRRSHWQPKRRRPACNTSHVERPVLSALVQTFGDGANAHQLAARLHELPLAVEAIVNDDSRRDHAKWLGALGGPNDFLLSSPNVHELRAYDRMARLARGDFLLLLQGDHCLPPSAAWLERALSLFARFSRLGMLGGHMGFDRVPLKRIAENVSWGTAPCAPIPTAARVDGGGGGAALDVPFMFVAGVNIGPLLVRREAFLAIGGFDETFSCPGEPGIQLDTELSLQLWAHGYQVGLWYSAVSNGVGGRKTRTNLAQKRARALNDAVNGVRCERVMRHHDAATVAAANRELAALRAPARAREDAMRELGWRVPKHCAQPP